MSVPKRNQNQKQKLRRVKVKSLCSAKFSVLQQSRCEYHGHKVSGTQNSFAVVFSVIALFISSKVSNHAGAFGVSFIILLVGMATEIFGTGLKKLLWPIVDFSFNSLGKLSKILTV